MPRRCCVPGCQSNHGLQKTAPTFIFPKDITERDAWVKAIHRYHFTPTSSSVVCVDHFQEEQVIRFNDPGKRMYTKLKLGAVPSIFDGQSGYLPTHRPPSREGVLRRELALALRDEEAMTNFMEEDNKNNFFYLLNLHKDKINCLNWTVGSSDVHIVFMKLDYSPEGIPCVTTSITIFEKISI